jgi:hypothetical protein
MLPVPRWRVANPDKVEGVKYQDLHHYTQGTRDEVCWIAHARVAPKTPNCTVRKARSAIRVLSSLLRLRRITPSSDSSIRRDSIFEHADEPPSRRFRRRNTAAHHFKITVRCSFTECGDDLSSSARSLRATRGIRLAVAELKG